MTRARAKSRRVTFGLTELSAVIGCSIGTVTRIVDSLGIRPYKVESRRRLFALNEAQVKQVVTEYHRLACRPGLAGGHMRRVRTRPPSAGARLEALWARWAAEGRVRRGEDVPST